MISLNNRALLDMPISDFIISSEKVAHVQSGNSAEHALLVLTKTGYSSIPVLDVKYRLQGLLSIKMITEAILGLERIEYDKLASIKVEDVMESEVAYLKTTDTFQRALDLVINHAFLCVVDGEEGTFAGIMTRRVILKQLKKYIYSNEK
ncbi:cyclic-di-AMP-binding protein CbpB [Solibacillus sp. CAU 1738]|uniref:cyclic-di-AMP-binding protein CbpB n=1 Tax=Solibacillus sp. CAU 1738 TaxID=3140363 RepID=UPI003260AA92